QIGEGAITWRYSATDALSGIDTVRLQVATDAEFQTLVFDAAVSASGRHDQVGAIAGQRLYARVNTTDKAGNAAPFSAPVDVLVVPPPAAGFTPSVLTGEAPLTVNFQHDSTGFVASSAWNFGEGRPSSSAQPSTRYTAPGSSEVRVRATGPGGSTQSQTTVVVTPDLAPPNCGVVQVD